MSQQPLYHAVIVAVHRPPTEAGWDISRRWAELESEHERFRRQYPDWVVLGPNNTTAQRHSVEYQVLLREGAPLEEIVAGLEGLLPGEGVLSGVGTGVLFVPPEGARHSGETDGPCWWEARTRLARKQARGGW